jgi:hypothetical protein
MATFKLFINADNSAFDDGNRNNETARILHEVADRLDNPDGNSVDDAIWTLFQTIYDSNGNDCGRYAFKRD